MRATVSRVDPMFFRPIVLLVVVFGCVVPACSLAQGVQDTQFAQAMAAYNANRFLEARELFQQVQGAHRQEASAYIAKMNAYKTAMDEGEMMLNRPGDEQDPKSLDFAIGEFQEALSIKRDGPGNPAGKIEQAKTMKAKWEQGMAPIINFKALCEKALAASNARHYDEAKLYSCQISDGDPSFSCGGDEAVHMCQQMTELASLKPGKSKASQTPQASAPPTTSAPPSALEQGKAAYETNDFQTARNLLSSVKQADEVEARNYLDRINLYEQAMSQGAQFSKENKYADARSAYEQAANLKQNGPGNPATEAAACLLKQGLDEFYSGAYSSSEQHLTSYLKESSNNSSLAHFYLGAARLGRYFLEGTSDEALHKEAISEMLLAKRANFVADTKDISPRILREYQQAF